jgi:GAF domain-containing protein
MPLTEAARQQAVNRSQVLQHRSDEALQRIVRMAVSAYDVRYAAITIIDRSRQWFIARMGLDMDGTSRDVSFCAHAIHRPGEPLIVADTLCDRRFSANPLVVEAPHVRFYAGMPIVDHGGYPLGALCILDSEPRDPDFDTIELTRLAREAERLICG